MADFVVEHQPQQQQKQQQKILVLQRDGTVTELKSPPVIPSHEEEVSDVIKMEEVEIEDSPHLELECAEEEVTLSPHQEALCHQEFIVESADNMGQEVVIGDVEEVVGAEEIVGETESVSVGHANGLSSSEAEMSVALDLAKMSQGHFTDNHTLNGHQFYEAAEEVVVASAEDMEETESTTIHLPENDENNDGHSSIRDFLPDDEISFQKPRLSYAQMIAEALLQVRL